MRRGDATSTSHTITRIPWFPHASARTVASLGRRRNGLGSYQITSGTGSTRPASSFHTIANDMVTVPQVDREAQHMIMMTPERQLVNPFFTGGGQTSVSYPSLGGGPFWGEGWPVYWEFSGHLANDD
jgi:hypothetical protein